MGYSLDVSVGQADCRPNIHWCMQESGGRPPTEYSLVYTELRRITDRIFIGVYRAQADCQWDIHWMYQWVRRIADIIFIGVYRRSQADY
jgi:hypothetical protein